MKLLPRDPSSDLERARVAAARLEQRLARHPARAAGAPAYLSFAAPGESGQAAPSGGIAALDTTPAGSWTDFLERCVSGLPGAISATLIDGAGLAVAAHGESGAPGVEATGARALVCLEQARHLEAGQDVLEGILFELAESWIAASFVPIDAEHALTLVVSGRPPLPTDAIARLGRLRAARPT